MKLYIFRQASRKYNVRDDLLNRKYHFTKIVPKVAFSVRFSSLSERFFHFRNDFFTFGTILGIYAGGRDNNINFVFRIMTASIHILFNIQNARRKNIVRNTIQKWFYGIRRIPGHAYRLALETSYSSRKISFSELCYVNYYFFSICVEIKSFIIYFFSFLLS